MNYSIGYARKAVRRDTRVDFGHLLNASTAYYERDACHLVRIISGAVAYLHEQGIVHRGEMRVSVNRVDD